MDAAQASVDAEREGVNSEMNDAAGKSSDSKNFGFDHVAIGMSASVANP